MSNSKWAALGAALLASTALTTGASAAEWTAKVSGAAEVGIAYVDAMDRSLVKAATTGTADQVLDVTDGELVIGTVTIPGTAGSAAVYSDNENVGLINDSEVRFDFKLVADNGITFGYHMELESEKSGTFDEFNAYVSGSFGTVELGQQDGAYDKLNLTPAGCSYSCPGDGDGYLFDHFASWSAVSIDGDGYDTSDALKLSYFTPKFMGFSAGVSWIPNTGDAEGSQHTNLSAEDASAWEFGAQWRGDITEDIDAGVSFVYALGDENSDANDEDSWSVAGEVGLFGGAVGARYSQDNTGGSSGAFDESTLSIGAEYGTGPWGFFINWAQTIDSDVASRDGDWGISGEVDYALAPGVDAFVIVEFGSPTEDDEDDEFAIGTGLGMSF